jgi:hypothetical protein
MYIFAIDLMKYSYNSALLTLTDPLGGRSFSVWGIVVSALNLVIPLSAIIFVVMVIYGGIMYMMNTMDSDKVKGAQTIIKNAITGMAIVASAFVMLRLVEKALYGN